MAVKYVLKLSEEEREELYRVAKGVRGKQAIAAWKVVRARSYGHSDDVRDECGEPDEAGEVL